MDVNIEVRMGDRVVGMLQLGEDPEEEEEDGDEEHKQEAEVEEDDDLNELPEEMEDHQEENEEIARQVVEARDRDEPEPDEDDFGEMFELAQAVVNQARQNQLPPQPPPLPPPPPPINRNLPQPNMRGGAARRPEMDRGVENVDIEVQLNLDIAGLRGPLFGFVAYCAMVVFLNMFCIYFGIVIPVFFTKRAPLYVRKFLHLSGFTVGQSLSEAISQLFSDHWENLSSSLAIFQLLLQPTTSTQIFRLIDILEVTASYLSISMYIYFFNSLLHIVARLLYGPITPGQTNPEIPYHLQFLLTYVSRTVDIIKIGILMTIRIFWLPCFIGCIIILCFNLLFQIPLEELFSWSGNHIIGAIAMCWGFGIGYMLTTTISILQLREILHPDWLSKFIRPQESQVELLTSLLADPPLIQLRRLFLSFCVYGMLILIFVLLPILIWQYGIMSWLGERSGDGTIPPIRLHFCYFTPDLQIFLEIGILHTVFLMVLENEKDRIGHLEYYVLKFLAKQFGISRYILPYAMKIISVLHDLPTFSSHLLAEPRRKRKAHFQWS